MIKYMLCVKPLFEIHIRPQHLFTKIISYYHIIYPRPLAGCWEPSALGAGQKPAHPEGKSFGMGTLSKTMYQFVSNILLLFVIAVALCLCQKNEYFLIL